MRKIFGLLSLVTLFAPVASIAAINFNCTSGTPPTERTLIEYSAKGKVVDRFEFLHCSDLKVIHPMGSNRILIRPLNGKAPVTYAMNNQVFQIEVAAGFELPPYGYPDLILEERLVHGLSRKVIRAEHLTDINLVNYDSICSGRFLVSGRGRVNYNSPTVALGGPSACAIQWDVFFAPAGQPSHYSEIISKRSNTTYNP